jgi:hypothetical protein
MSLAINENKASTITFIEEGKTWEGKDKTLMKEHRVSLKNGDMPIFNYPANKNYPFAKGDNVTYLLNEKYNEKQKKIIQYGKQMKKVENEQTTNTSTATNNSTLTQQQSIALSVASKLGFETVTSDAWQKTLELKGEDMAKAQNDLLTSIGQVSIAYYNLLTTKPQNNGS